MSELVYDCRNRLVRAGGITYTYDAENIRIKAETADYVEEYVTDTVSASLSRVLTMTVYEEKAGVTGTTTTYLYGQGLISEETEGNYLYHHYNNLGSTMKLTDGEGQVVESYTYGVYGELLSGDETLTRFLYNGRCGVSTEENGLYYMRQRYYNPQIKRFINQDILTGSLDNSQSLNRYSYVQGNPVSYTDPFGLSPVNGLFTDPNNIHSTLTVLGFTPGPGGVAADLLDAGIYLVEGDLSGTALAFLAVFCGSVALTGKAAKAGKAMNKANKLSNTSQLVHKASDMMSASSNFMKTAMNGSDVTQVVKTARQGRVIDKLKSAVTSAGNKFKSSKLYLNNIGAVDTRILNPSKWDDMVLDGGVLRKTSYGKSSIKNKTGPKPKGTGPHNLKIEEIASQVTDGQVIAGGGKYKERAIPTPNGKKSSRRPDILVKKPDGALYGINVGKTTANGAPIKREVEALYDLEDVGIPMYFVPYDK
ncbi:MAG: RHS repeat-associated core domain-containing protein [Lachnospiraceae bacterium]|nr:RHS repeat-associated core domain-containing protein [Lachnospiraceae bacterium]